MTSEKKTLLLPGLLITLGTGWLLSALNVAPGIHWPWTLGLAAIGLLTFAVGGIDKLTIVVGPALLAASCMSVLRQTGKLHVDIEIPLLVILAGILMLISRMRVVPVPKWAVSDAETSETRIPMEK